MTQGEKLSRRERERLRQRHDMLAAALELFSRNGYHNVSMNEIAEKAEFAVGTLYKFFKNKEDLYKSIMIEQTDWFHKVMDKAMDDGDDEIEKLRNYVRTRGVAVTEKEAVVRLYHAEIRGRSFNLRAGLDDEISRQLNELRERLTEIFASGIRNNLFRKIAEPAQLALALENICSGFIMRWLEKPENNKYPEDPDVILNIIFQGLIAG
ncbi:MAG: TetR/AcrR family transcriptional regulator [Deltaproteobacteria bacterium]|nr:TetR/AcrR family transcriptional regulator [Deltaproteobacteria bacterium]